MENNKDLLEVNSNSIVEKFWNKSYHKFVNRQGIYKVGNSFLKFENDKVLEMEGAELALLSTFKNAETHNIISEDGGNRANCAAFQHVDRTNGDRRVLFDIVLNYCQGCCGMKRMRATFSAAGEKLNLFNKWKSYSTAIKIQNGGYGVINSFGTYTTADNLSAATTSDDIILSFDSWIDPTFTGTTVSLNFDKVKGRATTRGTDDWHWAMDCCGYTSGCPDPNNP